MVVMTVQADGMRLTAVCIYRTCLVLRLPGGGGCGVGEMYNAGVAV